VLWLARLPFRRPIGQPRSGCRLRARSLGTEAEEPGARATRGLELAGARAAGCLGSVADVRTPDELRAAFTAVRTDRLLLRAVDPEDVEAVFAIHANPATYLFHPGGVARTREEATVRLARWRREWRELGFGFWAVSVPPTPPVAPPQTN
jgi:hypothetical protein